MVYFSYRLTIEAYPTGGGSYTVASENLGTFAGLLAASALMVDYVLVVGVEAVRHARQRRWHDELGRLKAVAHFRPPKCISMSVALRSTLAPGRSVGHGPQPA